MKQSEFDNMVYRWSSVHEMPHSDYEENATKACKERIENFFLYYNKGRVHKFMTESNETKREIWEDFLQQDLNELKTCLQYVYGIDLGAEIEED